MELNNELITKILLDGNYVDQEDMIRADEETKRSGVSIVDYLFHNELLSKDVLGQAVAEYLKVPYADLNSNNPNRDQVLLIPEDVAKKYRVIVYSQEKNKIVVATDNPTQPEIMSVVQPFFPNKKIVIAYSVPDDIDPVFSSYHKDFQTKFDKITASKGLAAPEIIDQLIEDALLLKASDVHCEPRENDAIIRFRLDGVLHDVGQIPRNYYDNVVSRLKVQSRLRIDEHFNSQDGAIRYKSKNLPRPVDLRISIVPTINGEKVVIRILSAYVRDLTLSDIGLSESLQEQITKSIKKPFGMILVTGPTGSGKTTTLYSIIKMINTRKNNITTIEDPVEYRIEGVNQIQVNPQSDLTFAKSLRAVMRQDPDTIFVGEIRDIETADIAVNAALTGHLLLSTFHANNAAAAIPRFIDMGIEPFLASSTIELIVAQRLVRKICDHCRVSYEATSKDLKEIDEKLLPYFKDKEVTLYRGKGCEHCSFTGFKGRIGVFEFLHSTPEVQELISQNPPMQEIQKLLKKQNFKSMFDDGLEKVKVGVTTIEELLRVVEII